MKRCIAIFLLLCLLFTGCAQAGPDSSAAPSVPEITTPAAPTADPSGQPSDGPDDAPSILDLGQPISAENDFLLSLPADGAAGMTDPDLFLMKSGLLLADRRVDAQFSYTELRLLSLEDGSVLASNLFKESHLYFVQADLDRIALSSPSAGTVLFLDETLTVTESFTPATERGTWYLSRDMETLYNICPNSGLYTYSLTSGAEDTLLPGTGFSVLGQNDWYVFFTYTPPGTTFSISMCLDLDSGHLETHPISNHAGSTARQGSLWLAQSIESYKDYYLFSDGDPKTVSIENGSLSLTPGKNHLLHLDRAQDTLAMYTSTGIFLAGCTLPQADHSSLSNAVWSQPFNGWFMLYSGDDTDHLLFWAADALTTGDNLPLGEADIPSDPTDDPATPSADPTDDPADPSASPEFQPSYRPDDGGDAPGIAAQAVYDRAAELTDRYGVRVLVADQCQLNYSSYSSYAFTDTEFVLASLDVLDSALGSYPEGFFRQLAYGNIKEVRIELVGGLVPKPGTAVNSSIAAFTQERSNHYLIVMDAVFISARNVYHEFSHIIDRKLAWDAAQRPDALFSEEAWLALQPEGFSYAYSYVSTPEETLKYSSSGYFISDYACTYPTEDRATLMASAMSNYYFEFSNFPALREKMSFYSQCIRDCFDTSGWPTVTAWEVLL